MSSNLVAEFMFPLSPMPKRLEENQNTGAFKDLRKQYKGTFAALESSDPLATALSFAALLLNENLQSSTYRIETLVNLALAFGRGKTRLKQKDFRRLYGDMEKGIVARQEDPAEDVFVSNISTMRGNFLVLEGLSEGAGYFLQVFMQMVDSFPKNESYDVIRDPVYALLTLSDEACKRAGLSRNQLGNEMPQAKLTPQDAERISDLRKCLTFSSADLDDLGIKLDDLGEFGFNPSARAKLLKQSLLHNDLERCPVCNKGGNTFLMLPTAVSGSIRRLVFEMVVKAYGLDTFLKALAHEYSKRLKLIPFLGEFGRVQLEFKPAGDTLMASVFRWVDDGRALHILFFMDNLRGFEKTGFGGWDKNQPSTSAAILDHIKLAKAKAEKGDDFKSGIILVVGCGVGRGIMHDVSVLEHEDWDVDFLSVHDFEALSNKNSFAPISLWRLKDAERQVSEAGIKLLNINGLLNLIAWREQLGGHLVPHNQVPDALGDGGACLIMVDQNALRTLRHQTKQEADVHSACKLDGSWTLVRRTSSSLSEEDKSISLYADMLSNESLPALLFEDRGTEWWTQVSGVEGSPRDAIFERWRMLSTWLPRIAQAFGVLEEQHKPPNRLQINATFDGAMAGLAEQPKPFSENELRETFSVSAQTDEAVVTVKANRRFEDAFFNEDNVAEREWVRAACLGVSQLAAEPLPTEQFEDLINSIVPNNRVRQTHAFPAVSFRDFVHHKLPRKPVFINDADTGTLKLFLGWKVRDRKLGATVQGKAECTAYLRQLVEFLENKLINFLRKFEKKSILQRLITNHEAAMCDQETWKRTAAAVSALHEDKGRALEEILKHQSKLNAVFQSSRVLVEVANCVCGLDDGDAFGEFDLAKSMAMMIEIIEFGGWSDAIHYGAMEPALMVAALGDVLANHDFFQEVVVPFGQAGMTSRVERSIQGYGDHFSAPKEKISEPEKKFAAEKEQFSKAWECELGFPIEAHGAFVVACEEVGLAEEKACFVVRKSELTRKVLDLRPELEPHLNKIFHELSLLPRSDWRVAPEGFTDLDRQPWKFRRLLSVLRRPLIQLDDAEDPEIYLWPGMVGDGGKYTFTRYWDAEFREIQIRTKEMLRWNGATKDKTSFNDQVAGRLRELGWTAKSDVGLTQILGRSQDETLGNIKKLGDVDVLAWDEQSRRVIAIECKDLMYRQTPGEIAEQLSSFRGELDAKGKPDLLLKHLNRASALRASLDELRKFTKISDPTLEDYLVFSGQVPMGYAKEGIRSKANMLLFDEIGTLALNT
ncbi:hypothetical protein [Jannaschia donghaensis]|nr:hypothetical protein [Jannaschia donghaensis]